MKHSSLHLRLIWLAVLLLVASPAFTQTAATAEGAHGVTFGGYRVNQSIEFGGHITDVNWSRDTWNTFVNIQDGPRLLDYTLSMRADQTQGMIFDDLYLSNFGYGGDPNNVSTVRIDKNKWYSFNGSFRRHKNYWDYNLLANPLNLGPQATSPATFFTPAEYTITDSPHESYLVRRMTDLNLTLAPQRFLSVRLGYNRNIQEGPQYWTFHEGADPKLLGDWRTQSDNYTIGADLNLAPRTRVSYTQYFNWYKGDTSYTLAGTPYLLANGVAADPGIMLETFFTRTATGTLTQVSAQPCSTPFGAQATGQGTNPPGTRTTTPDTLNSLCSVYTAYNRAEPIRRMFPTEQFSFSTSYWKRFTLAGAFAYNSMDYEVLGYNELFQGFVSRTRQREYNITGPIDNRRISVGGDLMGTLWLTDDLSLNNKFQFHEYRIAGRFDMTETSIFGVSNVSTTDNSTGHAAASPADLISELINRFDGDQQIVNTTELRYNIGRTAEVHAGYRFRNQQLVFRHSDDITQTYLPGGAGARRGACTSTTIPLNPDGSCTVTTTDEGSEEFDITQHSGLFGFWLRPVSDFRLSFDLEFMRGDGLWNRLTPDRAFRLKAKANYKPVTWLTLNGGVDSYDASNDEEDIDHDRRNRNLNFNATFTGSEKLTFDVGYNYQKLDTDTLFCYVLSTSTTPIPATHCRENGESFWNSEQNFANIAVNWRPVKRVMTSFGYAVTNVDGSFSNLHPLQPTGTSQFTYQSPMAMVGIGLTDRLWFKTAYNYYAYDEKAPSYYPATRDMDGRVVTLSLRYAF